MPAASAMRASLRLSGQVPDHRSGTLVTARPDEQFAPNKPSLSLLPPCIDIRSRKDAFASSRLIFQSLVIVLSIIGRGRNPQERVILHDRAATHKPGPKQPGGRPRGAPHESDQS